MSEQDDILRKIQKAMALANDKRGDPNTAAIAMRQAQKLMEAYNISHTAVLAAAVGESDLRSKVSVVNPAGWEANAMHFCATAFGCRLMWSQGGPEPTKKGYWSVYGPKMQLEICIYAMTVAMRALLKARTDFVKRLTSDPILGELARKEKSKMADDFCMGWGYAVRKQIGALADPDNTIKDANDAYRKEKYPDAGAAAVRESGSRNMSLMQLGAKAAEGFNLYRPMDQKEGSPTLRIGA